MNTGRPFAVLEAVEGSGCSLSSVVDMRHCGSGHCCVAGPLDEEEMAEVVGGCIEVAPVSVPVGSAAVGSTAAGYFAAAAGLARETDRGF